MTGSDRARLTIRVIAFRASLFGGTPAAVPDRCARAAANKLLPLARLCNAKVNKMTNTDSND
jgi:hypothetical protein